MTIAYHKSAVAALFAAVFGLTFTALADNDDWPVATQATTQSCWRAAADGKFSSAANWQHVEKTGGNWTWTGASGSVPVISSTELVNGFLFNKASDYTVDVDAATTVNYLYVGQDYQKSESGAVTLLVTNDLTFASPNATWTGYRLKYGDVFAPCQRLGLELSGPKVQMTVKDGAELKIKPVYTPETPNKNNYNSSNLGSIANGATLFVTNATLTLDNIRNNTYGNQHQWFRLCGTESATSTLHLVNSTFNYTGGNEDGVNRRQPLHFQEYARGVFTDTTMNMTLIDMQPSSASVPGPEILVNGNSVYRWQYSTYGTFQNGGHLIFDDNAKFEGDNASSKYYYVSPSLEGGTCHLEFRGNSSADFDKACNTEELRVGNAVKGTLTKFDWHTTGALKVRTAITVGLRYGEGRFSITNGTVMMPGYGNITLGKTDNSASANQCVTGRLDIAGGVLTAGTEGKATVQGLVVGGAYNLRSADATDYYSYGEVNVSGDCVVSNKSDVWIGTGLAKGRFRMTGGTFLSNGNLVLGAGGGEAEMEVLGGSYQIRDVWNYGAETSVGLGGVYIGGMSEGLMKFRSRYEKLPANFPHNRSGSGYLCVSNANFFVGAYGENTATDIGSCGTGTLELKNGAYYKTYNLAMTNGVNSTLKFTLSGNQAPQLHVYGHALIGPKAKLIVDARDYTGGEKWIQLVKFNRNEYPNKYCDGWGCSRNGTPSDWTKLSSVCDTFDEDAITVLGNAQIVQVTDNVAQGRAAGIWARVKIKALLIIVK